MLRTRTRHWWLATLLAGLFALVASQVMPPACADDADAVEPSAVHGPATMAWSEQALLDLTNADRATNGLPPLQFDPELLAIARARAASQLGTQELSHYTADGQLAFLGMLQGADIGFSLAGENLARSSASDAGTTARIEQALMNSPLHRKNILEQGFDHVAIGAATDGHGGIVYAEIFRGAR